MTRTHKHLVRIAALAAGLLPAIALAHPGHGETSSFVAGALHPVSGVDHLAAFIIVGALAVRLGGRHWWPMTAAFLGLLIAAWTSDSDGWRYAAGFMFTGAGLIAAAMVATRAATRLAFPLPYCNRTTLTDFGGRRSTSASPLRVALIFTGVIASGASTVLRASMVFDVSTRPCAPLAFAPATDVVTTASRFGSRFTNASCNRPSVSRAAETLTDGTV
jgi:hypothetical protein